LVITEPAGLAIEESLFSIQYAARVRWEWFYFGRPQTNENRYFEEFVNEGARLATTTNVDWYSPQFSPSLSARAVELL